MTRFIQHKRSTFCYRLLSAFIAFTFLFSCVIPPQVTYAQLLPSTVLNLPVPGTMVPISPGYVPAMLTGLTFHPENPLEFDFQIDIGDSDLSGMALEDESRKLIKYFLASLTVPEDELWVNLSPYEKDRIIPQSFGVTEMGRDLLAQDYLLKQLTASMMYPEDELGQRFWDRVYKKAYDLYGTTEIPMNTFNKIWIVPDEAVVFEKDASAYVIDSHLKVMLEEDYVALKSNLDNRSFSLDQVLEEDAEVISGVTAEVVREVLIPEIEKEVNEGKTFANLRQIYNSMILATWYKQNLRQSLLGQVYVDQNKIKGIDVEDKQVKQKIYEQYVEAFQKGVYNYIKEDYDPVTQDMMPRKYFSGGFDGKVVTRALKELGVADISEISSDPERLVSLLTKLDGLDIAEFDRMIAPAFMNLSASVRDTVYEQVSVYTDLQMNNVRVVLVENATDESKGITVGVEESGGKVAGSASSPVTAVERLASLQAYVDDIGITNDARSVIELIAATINDMTNVKVDIDKLSLFVTEDGIVAVSARDERENQVVATVTREDSGRLQVGIEELPAADLVAKRQYLRELANHIVSDEQVEIIEGLAFPKFRASMTDRMKREMFAAQAEVMLLEDYVESARKAKSDFVELYETLLKIQNGEAAELRIPRELLRKWKLRERVQASLEELAKVATAGMRETENTAGQEANRALGIMEELLGPADLTKQINAMLTLMVVNELGEMSVKQAKAEGNDHPEAVVAGEVRYNTALMIKAQRALLAEQGMIVHSPKDGDLLPIGATSFITTEEPGVMMTIYNTASHAMRMIFASKLMGYVKGALSAIEKAILKRLGKDTKAYEKSTSEGAQLLIEEMESLVNGITKKFDKVEETGEDFVLKFAAIDHPNIQLDLDNPDYGPGWINVAERYAAHIERNYVNKEAKQAIIEALNNGFLFGFDQANGASYEFTRRVLTYLLQDVEGGKEAVDKIQFSNVNPDSFFSGTGMGLFNPKGAKYLNFRRFIEDHQAELDRFFAQQATGFSETTDVTDNTVFDGRNVTAADFSFVSSPIGTDASSPITSENVINDLVAAGYLQKEAGEGFSVTEKFEGLTNEFKEDLAQYGGHVSAISDTLLAAVGVEREIRILNRHKELDDKQRAKEQKAAQSARNLRLEVFDETAEMPILRPKGYQYIKLSDGRLLAYYVPSMYDYSQDVSLLEVIQNSGMPSYLQEQLIGFINTTTDPDADRFVIIQVTDHIEREMERLKKLNVAFMRISENQILVDFTPNQGFFLIQAALIRTLIERGELTQHLDSYNEKEDLTFVGISTTVSTVLWRHLWNKYRIPTLLGPVGFKEISRFERGMEADNRFNDILAMYGLERQRVILHDVFGKPVSLGYKPRLLFGGEESGGMVPGTATPMESKDGTRHFVGYREKVAFDAMILTLKDLSERFNKIRAHIGGDLSQEQLYAHPEFREAMNIAAHLQAEIADLGIEPPAELRFDFPLIDQVAKGKMTEEEAKAYNREGLARRDRNDTFFVGLYFALLDKDIRFEELVAILVDAFKNSPEIRKQLTMGRKENPDQMINDLTDLIEHHLKGYYFQGDGVYFDFGDMGYAIIRPSGTEAKIKGYPSTMNEYLSALISFALPVFDPGASKPQLWEKMLTERGRKDLMDPKIVVDPNTGLKMAQYQRSLRVDSRVEWEDSVQPLLVKRFGEAADLGVSAIKVKVGPAAQNNALVYVPDAGNIYVSWTFEKILNEKIAKGEDISLDFWEVLTEELVTDEDYGRAKEASSPVSESSNQGEVSSPIRADHVTFDFGRMNGKIAEVDVQGNKVTLTNRKGATLEAEIRQQANDTIITLGNMAYIVRDPGGKIDLSQINPMGNMDYIRFFELSMNDIAEGQTGFAMPVDDPERMHNVDVFPVNDIQQPGLRSKKVSQEAVDAARAYVQNASETRSVESINGLMNALVVLGLNGNWKDYYFTQEVLNNMIAAPELSQYRGTLVELSDFLGLSYGGVDWVKAKRVSDDIRRQSSETADEEKVVRPKTLFELPVEPTRLPVDDPENWKVERVELLSDEDLQFISTDEADEEFQLGKAGIEEGKEINVPVSGGSATTIKKVVGKHKMTHMSLQVVVEKAKQRIRKWISLIQARIGFILGKNVNSQIVVVTNVSGTIEGESDKSIRELLDEQYQQQVENGQLAVSIQRGQLVFDNKTGYPLRFGDGHVATAAENHLWAFVTLLMDRKLILKKLEAGSDILSIGNGDNVLNYPREGMIGAILKARKEGDPLATISVAVPSAGDRKGGKGVRTTYRHIVTGRRISQVELREISEFPTRDKGQTKFDAIDFKNVDEALIKEAEEKGWFIEDMFGDKNVAHNVAFYAVDLRMFIARIFGFNENDSHLVDRLREIDSSEWTRQILDVVAQVPKMNQPNKSVPNENGQYIVNGFITEQLIQDFIVNALSLLARDGVSPRADIKLANRKDVFLPYKGTPQAVLDENGDIIFEAAHVYDLIANMRRYKGVVEELLKMGHRIVLGPEESVVEVIPAGSVEEIIAANRGESGQNDTSSEGGAVSGWRISASSPLGADYLSTEAQSRLLGFVRTLMQRHGLKSTLTQTALEAIAQGESVESVKDRLQAALEAEENGASVTPESLTDELYRDLQRAASSPVRQTATQVQDLVYAKISDHTIVAYGINVATVRNYERSHYSELSISSATWEKLLYEVADKFNIDITAEVNKILTPRQLADFVLKQLDAGSVGEAVTTAISSPVDVAPTDFETKLEAEIRRMQALGTDGFSITLRGNLVEFWQDTPMAQVKSWIMDSSTYTETAGRVEKFIFTNTVPTQLVIKAKFKESSSPVTDTSIDEQMLSVVRMLAPRAAKAVPVARVAQKVGQSQASVKEALDRLVSAGNLKTRPDTGAYYSAGSSSPVDIREQTLYTMARAFDLSPMLLAASSNWSFEALGVSEQEITDLAIDLGIPAVDVGDLISPDGVITYMQEHAGPWDMTAATESSSPLLTPTETERPILMIVKSIAPGPSTPATLKKIAEESGKAESYVKSILETLRKKNLITYVFNAGGGVYYASPSSSSPVTEDEAHAMAVKIFEQVMDWKPIGDGYRFEFRQHFGDKDQSGRIIPNPEREARAREIGIGIFQSRILSGETVDAITNDAIRNIANSAETLNVNFLAKIDKVLAASSPVGGIDLDPALLDLQIRRDGNGIPLPLPQQPIYNMKIDGFLPVIINITPVVNMMPMLLGGLVDGEDGYNYTYEQDLAPADKIGLFTVEENEPSDRLV